MSTDVYAMPDAERRDRAVMLHGSLPLSDEARVVLRSGSGARVTDTDGRDYLDMHASAWLCQVGHGRDELADIAAAQMRELEHFTTAWNYSNEPAIALAERLVSLSPMHAPRVIFTSTGSEGDEVALTMSRYYHFRRGEPDRTVVLALRGAYHGHGAGGASLADGGLHAGFGPVPGGVVHLTPPWPYHPELHDHRDPTDYCVEELERTIAEVGAHRIAAMFGEPVMGPAGMIPLPDDYWPRMVEVLRRHGILVVIDEVVTGFGRIGHWFAAERYGLSPDITVTAKGIASGYMPLGAVLANEQVCATIAGGDEGFPFAASYGGHPVACAVGLGSIDIIEREGLLQNSTEVGGHLLNVLRDDLGDIDVVGDIHGLGLMIGVELVADRETRERLRPSFDLAAEIRERTGVLVGFGGLSTVELTPPLVLTRTEAEEASAALREVLALVTPDGRLRG